MRVSSTELGLGGWTAEPLTNISPEVAEFWRLLEGGIFSLCKCQRCGKHFWPYTLCNQHDEIPEFADMEWSPVSGRGSVFASVVVERVLDRDYADEVPFCLALIELDEGPLFPSRIAVDDPYAVSVGDAVRVLLVDVAGADYRLPFFELESKPFGDAPR